jgi:hypothetical protein
MGRKITNNSVNCNPKFGVLELILEPMFFGLYDFWSLP